MSIQVALLRGINVGGHKMVAMSDLRDLCEALGFSEVKSLLQSGNLVFQSDRRAGAALERLLEVETAKRLGVSADYIVRSATEWKAIVARNPFPDEAESDPGHFVVMCLKTAPQASDVKALQAAFNGPEEVRCVSKQLYVTYPEGIGRSKLTNALIEKKLGTRGTGRNWNTVLKLAE
ncbi:MAG: DUF1697 domain-containing protein [Acidobacteriales bacterium]|nr:DUF1697 domain-containing protein [Terriglobales bacterium]